MRQPTSSRVSFRDWLPLLLDSLLTFVVMLLPLLVRELLRRALSDVASRGNSRTLFIADEYSSSRGNSRNTTNHPVDVAEFTAKRFGLAG